MLDPIDAALLHPVFDAVLTDLKQSGSLSAFRRSRQHVLIAFDGTEYKTKTEYFHTVLAASVSPPDTTTSCR
jgi:hypothetical protein